MTMKKISIIIIAYKVGAYIEQCLESVCNQTYQNLEIIIVAGTGPNGETDECFDICERFAKADSRIKLVITKAQGASDARNKGLAEVTGDLIGFVDGDDYIEQDMYEYMLELMNVNRAQVAVCGRFYEYKNATLKDEGDVSEVMTASQAIQMVLSGTGFYLHCWDKLYEASLWKGIIFPIDRYVEDRIVVDKVLSAASTVVYNRLPKYHFRERSGSLSKTGSVAHNNNEANKELCSFVKQRHPELSDLCDKYMLYESITALQNVYMSQDMKKSRAVFLEAASDNEKKYNLELQEYRQQIKDILALGTKNPLISWKLKLKSFLALNMPWILTFNTKRRNSSSSLKRFE